ncbi:facilitated trehalose transporter Tret1 [Diaphorina citri]|uniref:Facilitated trehalose transporter Tret1 n=1 Tax=Diaphorina citri TaxID=121845 RepID=A0A3Q0J2K2_DIACI|nr:facilitated trehalose transporter Tret1 [Diaphorina citri]
MAQSLLLLSIGMIVASPTIVIGALYKNPNNPATTMEFNTTKPETNATQNSSGPVETLFFTDSQASWFGSILLLCQPVGSIASCFVQGYLGRRKSMLLVNLPLILGWYLLFRGESVEMLFTSAIISGLSIGFMEAPTLAYIGEVSEPRLRGTFTSILNTHVCIGHLLEFLIGCAVGQENWRTAMLISIIVPVLTILIIYQIPESPVWLLSKGRKQEALKSLCWLRGWVEEKAVAKEFQSFVKYNELSQRPITRVDKDNTMYKQVPTKAYINADGSGVIPAETVHPVKQSALLKMSDIFRPAFLRPLRLILLYMFFTHMSSLNAIRPYMIKTFGYLGLPIEPLRVTVMTASLQLAGGRGAGGGISAAFFYTGAFVASFTFLDLQHLLNWYGVFYFYGTMSAIGVVFIFFCLPETEGRTLAEIETYFAQHSFVTSRKFTRVQNRVLP